MVTLTHYVKDLEPVYPCKIRTRQSGLLPRTTRPAPLAWRALFPLHRAQSVPGERIWLGKAFWEERTDIHFTALF
jgi:hypothetical protein